MPGTRKLGRVTEHRMSMLKGMVTYLLENGKIETTVTRAKEVSALADKMITVGKDNTLASKRRALAFLKKEDVVFQLFNKIAPFYAERTSGYTAVYKLGPRRGDGAEMALITLVDADSLYKKDKKDKKDVKKEDKKDDKKAEKQEAKKEAKAV
jgi:large subunit ribosomal protein L17